MTERNRSPYSPTVSGYALAILVALSVFALGLLPVEALFNGTWEFHWSAVLAIMVIGAIPAALIGVPGAAIVHFTTRGVAAQRWHVLAATVAGVVAGALVYQDLPIALLLGLGTGLGRLAVSHERFLGDGHHV
ncbi:hypothetical protein [Nocardioides gilvus]|uniref:hypothetical protein n=1 Tax=Nocardioides gilvus TaxID=1735589 RepID=UPI0013A539E4|nr:hypothetical protein [Nocardioides gilvus]